MMQPIQIVALIAAVFFIARVLVLWRSKKINTKSAFFWFLIWAGVLFVAFATPVIDALSRPIGVGRGIDMIVYLSVLCLFYMVFRLYTKIDKLEQEITRLVREIALKK